MSPASRCMPFSSRTCHSDAAWPCEEELIAVRQNRPGEKLSRGSLLALLGADSGLPAFSIVRRCYLFRSPFSDDSLVKQRKNDICEVFIKCTGDIRDGVC